MEKDTLVEEVLNELYHRLKIVKELPEKPQKLVFLGEPSAEERKLLENGFQLIPAEKIRSENILYSVILICRMSPRTLAALAAGYAEGQEEKIILDALLKGKQVYVLEEGLEYKQYKDTAYKTLYSLYCDYENKIIQYGVKPIASVVNLLDGIVWKEAVKQHSIEINLTSKKLLSEADLMKMNRQNPVLLRLNKSCIVTPSAEDFIRSHQIEIIRE